ncbi:MAG: branched-chain amino acid ABC transporter permease [Deltaproteobacteria bacterium]|nr:branched-chain amino acid ABC transporter permease [Candidatus Anaeroferrophillus wilburensis]MBN2888443.1 branched-chain amino acid ABC transporter permease [Deltaproteobacteria bacterium]
MKKGTITLLVVGLVLLFFPLAVHSSYYQHLLIITFMWVIIGSSWNLLAGYTGQVSFGHAIFFGVGAYTAGILFTKLGVSPWWGMLFGGFVSMAIALFVGWVCFRLRGPYFALATLAGGEIIRLIATNWEDLTDGMVGILLIPAFKSKLPYYYLALALAVVCIYVIHRIMQSKWGFYFVSIREDQDAAESMGINTTLYKNISLLVSAFFTGMAGAFYMNYMGFIDPEVVFSLHYISIMAILVGIVGGVATIMGPAVGAVVMVGLQETFRSSFFGLAPKWVSQGHALVFGLLVIFVIMFLANGIVGDWEKIRRHVFRSKAFRI